MADDATSSCKRLGSELEAGDAEEVTAEEEGATAAAAGRGKAGLASRPPENLGACSMKMKNPLALHIQRGYKRLTSQ